MARKGLTINVIGVDKVLTRLQRYNSQIKTKSVKAIAKATLFIESEVKESIVGNRAEKASVDTGLFVRSVVGESRGFIGKVKSNVIYAKFLEFGTSRMSARRHFRNSVARNRDKVIDFIRDAVKER